MKASVTPHPSGAVVIALGGEIDLSSRTELMDIFREAMDLTPRLIVDLADVTFMDSTGLSVLLWGHSLARENGGHQAIVGAPPHVARILEITQLDAVLELFPDDVEDAVLWLQARSPVPAGD
jgi:anti-sigma B factor antagonist